MLLNIRKASTLHTTQREERMRDRKATQREERMRERGKEDSLVGCVS